LITQKSMRERSYEEHIFIENMQTTRKASQKKWRLANKDKISASGKIYSVKSHAKYPGKRAVRCKKWNAKQTVFTRKERRRKFEDKYPGRRAEISRKSRCKQANKWHTEHGPK
jgi:hypothetical protein